MSLKSDRVILFLCAAAVLGAGLIAATLYAWGQPLICTCGYIQLFVSSIWSSGNSQHVADWYTFSHVAHGMLVILLGRIFPGLLTMPVLISIAIVTGVLFEIVEHTDWVLGKFRAMNVNQGYVGDSVLNSVADYVSMWIGFALAAAVRTSWIVISIVILEIGSAAIGRDNLSLTTIRLVHDFEAIDSWQQEINPRNEK